MSLDATKGGLLYGYEAKVTIPSAQILTSFTTPIQLLPAPWVGKTYKLLMTQWRLYNGTTPYTLPWGGTLKVSYQSFIGAGTYFLSAPVLYLPTPNGAVYSGLNASNDGQDMTENEAMFLQQESADPTLGDADLDIYITYKIITI